MYEHFYDTREEASLAAADHIANALEHRLGLQSEASLVVSGGTTPSRCFEILAHSDIDWARVHVLLSDERWVPVDHESSNERLVRTTLLKNGASAAQLLPAYASDIEVAEAAAALDEAIRARPFPFAAALLGMGTDGHFASLFADAGNLDDGLDADGATLAIPVTTAASSHPRISLTLAALSRSDQIQLLFFGEEKRAVYEAAKANGASTYPVASLLRQKRAPVHVIWAP